MISYKQPVSFRKLYYSTGTASLPPGGSDSDTYFTQTDERTYG